MTLAHFCLGGLLTARLLFSGPTGAPGPTEPVPPFQGSPAPRFLHAELEQHPYYQNKDGFRRITLARNHAYKEFLKRVRQGSIDPSTREFFSYLYAVQEPGAGHPLYFHTPWESAVFMNMANGCEHYCIQVPFAQAPGLTKISMLHSHPTNSVNGAGPSRMDVALASTYRKPDGRYRYLYLINNQKKLIRYKALRPINPTDQAALLALPLKPRLGREWLD